MRFRSFSTVVYVLGTAVVWVGSRQRASVSAQVHSSALDVVILLVATVWLGVNLVNAAWGLKPLDRAPCVWQQGRVELTALLTTAVVLIMQNRIAKLGDRLTRLDFKVSLLIEQETAKLIALSEDSGAACPTRSIGMLWCRQQATHSADFGVCIPAFRVRALKNRLGGAWR